MEAQHLTARPWVTLAAAGCFASAIALDPPTLASIQEPGNWLLRPAALPFAWRSLEEATSNGDASESFARAQQLLHLLPTWTDAQIVFAFRFATNGGTTVSATGRAQAAHARMQIALAWLESARAQAGGREVELLQAMALLPEVATGQEPGLEALLRANGDSSADLAYRYLAEAERLSGSPAVREQRTFFGVLVVGAMLARNDWDGAITVLGTLIARSADVRDRQLATEWAARLAEVRRHLRGQTVDLEKVRADPRMAPLLPYLR